MLALQAHALERRIKHELSNLVGQAITPALHAEVVHRMYSKFIQEIEYEFLHGTAPPGPPPRGLIQFYT
jgi:hypothetical protein